MACKQQEIVYSGAGNSFVMVDGRVSAVPDTVEIVSRCKAEGTDGLIVLMDSSDCDFDMLYFNADGSGGMMCGNGGRCIVAFAADLGITPSNGRSFVFNAPDSVHEASILSENDGVKTICLGMKDVDEMQKYKDGWFLDTGTRHFVCFTDDVDAIDIEAIGPLLRNDSRFAPIGVNVNFVQVLSQGKTMLKVRTFEKGVEGETLACGTGIVAMCMASCLEGFAASREDENGLAYDVEARGGKLSVSFVRQGEGFRRVLLTGPARRDK